MPLETAEQFWNALRASDLLPRPEIGGREPEQGTFLGQYRILERLAAGGMGEVFKAEHVLMKRVVALKIIGRSTPHGHQALNPPHAPSLLQRSEERRVGKECRL